MRNGEQPPEPDFPGELVKARIQPDWADALPDKIAALAEAGCSPVPDMFDSKSFSALAGCAIWLSKNVICTNDIAELKGRGVVDLSFGDEFPLMALNLSVRQALTAGVGKNDLFVRQIKEFGQVYGNRRASAFWLMPRSAVNEFEYVYDLERDLRNYKVRHKTTTMVVMPSVTVSAEAAFRLALERLER